MSNPVQCVTCQSMYAHKYGWKGDGETETVYHCLKYPKQKPENYKVHYAYCREVNKNNNCTLYKEK